LTDTDKQNSTGKCRQTNSIQIRKSRQPKIQQNKTNLVQLLLTTLGQETRWAYSTPPPSPHGAKIRWTQPNPTRPTFSTTRPNIYRTNTTRPIRRVDVSDREPAVTTLSGNSLRQTVHTHRASVHQAVKLVAALLRVAGVTASLWRNVMAAYRRVYDSCHLHDDCQEPGSAPKLYDCQSSMGYLYLPNHRPCFLTPDIFHASQPLM